MPSINTNYGAAVALQSLNKTNAQLQTTQNRINTGQKVSSAKDNGAIFAIAAGTIREASKLLPDGDFMVRGITVLACMNTIQVVLMGLYLARRDRPQLGKVWVSWRSSIWVGIFSVLGSAGWALAMTLENAALVRAVGQIELVERDQAGENVLVG